MALIAAALINNEGNASTFVREDSQYYLRTAAIYAGKDREDFPFKGAFVHKIEPSVFRRLGVPLYPLLLSVFFRVSAPGLLIPILLNIMFFFGAACFLYRTGSLFLGTKVSLLATVLFCVYPSTVIYSVILMPESMFLFFLLSGIYYFAVFIKKGALPALVLSAFLIALSSLTKEVSIFLPGAMAILILLKIPSRRKNAITGLAVLAAIYIAMLSSLILINYTISGQASFSKRFSTHMRYFTKKMSGKHPAYQSPADYLKNRTQFFAGTGTIATLRVLGHDVSRIESSTNDPRDYLRSLGQEGPIWPVYQCAAWAIAGLLYLGSIAGFFRLLVRKDLFTAFFIAIFPLYFLTAYFYHKHPITRYFIPLVPFLALLSADIISAGWDMFPKKGATKHV